jgi:TonB-linked SusC/RagA family outer membrane protein
MGLNRKILNIGLKWEAIIVIGFDAYLTNKIWFMMKSLKKKLIFTGLMTLFLAFTALGQFTVTGNVTDETGQPLLGATVAVKGTTLGTFTGMEGEFSIEIPDDMAILVITFTGYKSQEIEVSPTNNRLDISMGLDIANLEEVVITGLGATVKRANSGNAITTVNAEDLTGKTKTQTIDNAIYGKIPGVQMTSNSGAPGGGVNVQLRGISTLGAGTSQPLYIVDGAYVDNSVIRNGRTNVNGASGGQSAATQDDGSNRIADLNPEDIEKIEVLKGPSAAAIYGTRANAGVILITTKRGQAGQTRIRLSQDVGIAEGQNFQGFGVWDEQRVMDFYGSQSELDKLRAAEAEGRNTDWEEYFYGETGFLSNTQLSISGGTQNTQFYISGGAQSEEGIIKNTGFDRYSLRANIDQRVLNKISISLNANYIKTKTERGFTGNQNNTGGSIGYNIAYTPSYADLYPDENGMYPNSSYFNDNPIAIVDLGTNTQDVNRYVISSKIDYDLYNSTNTFLKLRLSGGVDYLSSNTLVHFPEILQHQQAQANPGDVMWGRQDITSSNLQAFLLFSTNVGALNSYTTLGAIRLDQDSEFLLNRGRGLSGGQTNLAWARVVSAWEQTNQEVTDVGVVVQEDLNWNDQIVASVGVRFDKSTLNADQDKYYFFPKASLALNLHNFNFWNVGLFDQVKLRVAYGETGGLPNFGVTFESLTAQLIGGGLGAQVSARAVDPNLEPETAAELEIGLDLGFWNGRVSLEATYYNKKVRDLILDQQTAESTGITAIATNAADLENRGFELSLGINPINSTNVNWYSKILWWTNESEITEMKIPTQTVGGFGPSLGTYLFAEGYSPTTIVGTPSGTDIPGGFTVYGDRQPDFQMSFYNTVTFLQDFEFSFLLHWFSGGEAINLSALLWDDGGTTPGWNQDDDGDGTPNGLQRLLDWAVNGNTGAYIEPTDYLKLREVALYYTLPNSLFDGWFIDNVKVGVSANNILVDTKYGSYDPEVSNFGVQPISSNIEVTPYPSSRRIFFHLKVDF